MTRHNVPRISGRPVDELLDELRVPLTEEILHRLRAELPAYDGLPEGMLTDEVTQACLQGMRLFGAALRSGEVDHRTLDRARRGAARRAEELIPLPQLLSAYGVGVEVCHQRLREVARPEDLEAVLTVQQLALQFLRDVGVALAEGYTAEEELLRDDELTRRHALLEALLGGEDPEQAANQAGVRLPTQYAVLSVAFTMTPADPPAGGEQLDLPLLARRASRRVREALARRTRGMVLARLSSSGGVVLVPMDGALTPAQEDEAWQRLVDLLGVIEHDTSVRIAAGATLTTPQDLVAAGKLAGELLELGRTLGRPGPLYRLADLALEYQLTRPGPALEHVAGPLTALRDEPALLTSLRAYLANDLNRRRTARQLDVHPNTVDNRLRKITALTGLDVGRRTDLIRISAALTVLGA